MRFEPLRPFFLDVFQAAQAVLPTLPHAEALAVALDRNWSSDDPTKPPTSPALVGKRKQNSDLPLRARLGFMGQFISYATEGAHGWQCQRPVPGNTGGKSRPLDCRAAS